MHVVRVGFIALYTTFLLDRETVGHLFGRQECFYLYLNWSRGRIRKNARLLLSIFLFCCVSVQFSINSESSCVHQSRHSISTKDCKVLRLNLGLTKSMLLILILKLIHCCHQLFIFNSFFSALHLTFPNDMYSIGGLSDIQHHMMLAQLVKFPLSQRSMHLVARTSPL